MATTTSVDTKLYPKIIGSITNVVTPPLSLNEAIAGLSINTPYKTMKNYYL